MAKLIAIQIRLISSGRGRHLLGLTVSTTLLVGPNTLLAGNSRIPFTGSGPKCRLTRNKSKVIARNSRSVGRINQALCISTLEINFTKRTAFGGDGLLSELKAKLIAGLIVVTCPQVLTSKGGLDSTPIAVRVETKLAKGRIWASYLGPGIQRNHNDSKSQKVAHSYSLKQYSTDGGLISLFRILCKIPFIKQGKNYLLISPNPLKAFRQWVLLPTELLLTPAN